MTPITASAPAKLILCGEHAVVYGRPAIALPLAGIRAHAEISPGQPGRGVRIRARDLRRRWRLADDPGHPFSELVAKLLAETASSDRLPDLNITLRSSIPIASGMGSGAAVATALVRVLAAYLGCDLAPAAISALVFASEQRFHGTPSGLDNTVIAYEQPIWFQRTKDEGRKTNDEIPASSSVLGPSSETQATPLIEPIIIAAPFTLLIADTGVRSPTRAPVGAVRERWQAEPARYEGLFDEVGALVTQARACLARGDLGALGLLLSHNHSLLQRIGVSSPELDALVAAAQAAGALGAKLSGAGWGGVMLALVDAERHQAVAQALHSAGAQRVIATAVQQHFV